MRIYFILISILFSETLDFADSRNSDPPSVVTKDGKFLVRGQKQFLLGISYFDGLSAPAEIQLADFDELRSKGFNAIRVWGTWYRDRQPRLVPLFRRSGTLNPDGIFLLRRMLTSARQKGLITVLTFSRDPLDPISFNGYKRGVISVASRIKEFRSVMIDIQNETNHCGGPRDLSCSGHLSLAQVANIRIALRQVDPTRLVTASRSGEPIVQGKDDYGTFRAVTGVDYISTHRPSRTRDAVWAHATDDEIRHIRSILGSSIPILLDEPNRCYSNMPCVNSAATKIFYTAARNAKTAGAAGWFFHTKAGFRLSSRSLFAQMNPVERQVVLNLARILRPIP